MMKPVIICIVGHSGSGKSLVADYLKKKHDIPMIQSRTTRKRRTPDEDGHMFVSEEEFRGYDQSSMLAFTTFGESRYCCLRQDVKFPVMVYVIDETGLEYFLNHFSGEYRIFSIFIKRPYEARVKCVGQDRMDRDQGMYYLPDEFFDFIIDNENGKKYLYQQINMILKLIEKK